MVVAFLRVRRTTAAAPPRLTAYDAYDLPASRTGSDRLLDQGRGCSQYFRRRHDLSRVPRRMLRRVEEQAEYR